MIHVPLSYFDLQDGNGMTLDQRINALTALGTPICFDNGRECRSLEEITEVVQSINHN